MVDLPPMQSATDTSSVAVIHLSSYDDQDWGGERNRPLGPQIICFGSIVSQWNSWLHVDINNYFLNRVFAY